MDTVPMGLNDSEKVKEMEIRLAKIEKEGRVRFLVQVWMAPAALALIGFLFSQHLEYQRADLQQVEREAKRAEAITAAVPLLTTGPAQRALLEQAVLSTIVADKNVRDKISVVVNAVVKEERDKLVANLTSSNLTQATQQLSQTQETAKKLGTAPPQVQSYYNEKSFYVVVESEKDESVAIRSAQGQPGAEVWATTNPFFAVTLSTKTSFSDAKLAGNDLVAKGKAKEYFVLSDDYMTRRVYPK